MSNYEARLHHYCSLSYPTAAARRANIFQDMHRASGDSESTE